MSFKVQDYYFKKAKKESFVARSVYKLEEIDKKFKVIKKGDCVADLGYHPGSWIQYTSKKIGEWYSRKRPIVIKNWKKLKTIPFKIKKGKRWNINSKLLVM